MRTGCTLGVDVGTGSVKATVLDPGRAIVGHGRACHPLRSAHPGWAEQDPRDWWRATTTAIRGALHNAGAHPGSVGAIAVSGQGAALVLLDKVGDPTRPALIHLDQRASVETDELIASGVGEAVRRASGNALGAWNTAAKLAWVRRWDPDGYGAATTVTSAAGYLLTQLTGRAVQSTSDAGISDLFDLRQRTWALPIAAMLELPPALLPLLASATEDLGPLTPAAAQTLGLPATVRVVAGGEDTSSAALAAGVLGAGDGYVSLGTAGVVGVARVAGGHGVIDEPRLLTFPHVRTGQDLLSGSMSSAGAALTWWATVTGTGPDTLLNEAKRCAPGAHGAVFLPYLAGELHPINDPAARGIFAGLSLSTTRGDLTRAIIEGSANAIAHNLEIAAAAGAEAPRLAATGRPTRSPVWMQAIADATGRPLDACTEEGAPLGDAVLAASETDSELPALVAAHHVVRESYEPSPAEHHAAAERRALTASLYAAVRSHQ